MMPVVKPAPMATTVATLAAGMSDAPISVAIRVDAAMLIGNGRWNARVHKVERRL